MNFMEKLFLFHETISIFFSNVNFREYIRRVILLGAVKNLSLMINLLNKFIRISKIGDKIFHLYTR